MRTLREQFEIFQTSLEHYFLFSEYSETSSNI